MDSAALAAYVLIALASIGATIVGFIVGFVLARRMADRKELVSEEEIMQIFPTSDPFEWDHLSVPVEQEQQL